MKENLQNKSGAHWLLLVLLLPTMLTAQVRQITGKVTDEKNEPVPGVSIYQKGTTAGTISDVNGNFKIDVTGATLVFSFIGFTTQEIAIDNKQVINVVMKENTTALDEVVVVGYGEQKRSNLTGAVTSVSVTDMENKTQLRLDQALQGMAAGVTVARNGGAPGAAPTIHIRGAGSISNTDPLWIVDGVRMDPGNQFDVDDVESMEILKDASASAIYGAKAAHGVILVTTKRGKGETRITFKSSISKRTPIALPELLGSQEFVNYKRQGRLAAGQNPEPAWDNWEHDTDWVNAFYNGSGMLKSYDLSLSKGDDKHNYFISFAHDDEDGILIDNGFKRYSARINSDTRVRKWLKVGESLLISNVTENPIGNNNENYSGAIPYRSIPIMPIYDPNNSYGGWGRGPVYFQGPNPVATQYQQHEKRTYNRIDANAYAEVSPVKGLMLRGTFGYNYLAYIGNRFEEAFDYGSFADPINKLRYSTASNQSLLGNMVATYETTFNKHAVKGMLGYEAFRYDPLSFNVMGTGFVTDVAASFNLGSGAVSVPDRFMPGQERMLSQFGRVNYNYDDRILIEANFRRDASSKFGPNNRWGVFPSVSAGWRISEEKFFENVPIISNLKVRASTGKLGSDNPLGNFLFLKSYTSQFSTYAFDATGANKVSGFFISKFPNTEVQWEEINMHNIAMDMKAFKNKLSLIVEYYIKDTKQLLYPVPIPSSVGISVHNFDPVNPEVNIGTMRNAGLDVELGYNTQAGKFNINTSGNVSFMRNKMLSLVGDQYVTGGNGGGQIGGMTRTQPGYPISSFFGYQVRQMLNNANEVFAINTWSPDGIYQEAGTGPGDFMYWDLNDDGKVTPQHDRTFIGNPWPKMTYALNVNATYNNMFDLSLQFQGVAGVEIFNAGKAYARNFFGDNNTTVLIREAWTAENHTQHPRNIASDPNGNFGRPSDYFVEKGDYLKLRNVQLGFNVPAKTLQRIKVSKLRVYLNANNFLTFTKYSGFDPEIAGSNTSRGVDYGQYPQVRTISAGVEVQF